MTVLPRVPAGNNIAIFVSSLSANNQVALLANFNSLILDYVVRLKQGNAALNFFMIKQLPVLPPTAYTPADIEFIAPRVLELVYTAWDMKPFAEDMGYHGEPFRWDEERRGCSSVWGQDVR